MSKITETTLTRFVKDEKMSKVSFQELVEKKYGIDRNEQIAKRLKDIPILYRPVYKRAIAHKSMRAAVNSQCLECVSYQRKEVSVCTDLACPLYLYRPYQKRISGDDTPPDISQDGL